MKLNERRATNIGLLYPKVRNNIGGDIPVDVPPTKILGGCVPGIAGGVDTSAAVSRLTEGAARETESPVFDYRLIQIGRIYKLCDSNLHHAAWCDEHGFLLFVYMTSKLVEGFRRGRGAKIGLSH